MKKNDMDIQALREQIRKGLELTFQKLIKQKKAQNGIFIFSEEGKIKRINVADINN